MNIYETIQARRSVRNFKPNLVEPDKLNRIFEAVRQAPSACNIQPWKFILVKSPEAHTRLKGVLQDWALTAPLHVVALGNPQTAWHRDGESIHPVDVAIAVEHLILAATAEGLGTCWICAFDRKALIRALQLDPGWDPVAITPLGYPDDNSPRSNRKPVGDIVQVV